MQGISSITGGMSAPIVSRNRHNTIPHQTDKSRTLKEKLTDQIELSTGADPMQASTSEMTQKMAHLQKMMETLKSIESRTADLKSFSDALDGHHNKPKFDSGLNWYAQIENYLKDQVDLLLGLIEAKEHDLFNRFKVDIGLNAEFAKEMASYTGEQMHKCMDIILGLEPHERTRMAKLLRNSY